MQTEKSVLPSRAGSCVILFNDTPVRKGPRKTTQQIEFKVFPCSSAITCCQLWLRRYGNVRQFRLYFVAELGINLKNLPKQNRTKQNKTQVKRRVSALKAVAVVPPGFEKYPPTNFWGVVLFLLPTLLCSLSMTGGRSNAAMLLGSAMGLGSLGTSPREFKTRKW